MGLKKIAFSFFSLFLFYQTVQVLIAISKTAPTLLGPIENLLYSFFLNLCITGIFAFIGFVYPTHKLLADTYYKKINRDRINSIYAILRVSAFRYLLLLLFWGQKIQRKKFFSGKKSGLKKFIYQTKQSEFGHLAAFICLFITSVYLLIIGHLSMALWVFGINFIGNFYPIILQRHHRARLSNFNG